MPLIALQTFHAAASENVLAFLGPEGTYSAQAAREYVSRAGLSGAIPLKTITEISEAVREGRAPYGLLPFENSIGGFVGETHRLLLAPGDPGWRVVGEVTIPISENLLVKKGAKLSDLRKIVSHPEALKQSARWLKANLPNLPIEGVDSTAAAAEAVLKSDGTVAAIASPAAAKVYQLQILFPDIQDDKRNATTFLIAQSTGRDFAEHFPTRLIVKLNVPRGDDILTKLVEDLHHLSFTLTGVDNSSTGELGVDRLSLIFDSKEGAKLEEIQSILGSSGALLIGAYRSGPLGDKHD